MTTTTLTRRIDAPLDEVFEAVADRATFGEVVPDIVDVEFLTEEHSGVGTRILETRVSGSKTETTELVVTEYEDNDHVRFMADDGATRWDTVIRVEPRVHGTELSITLNGRPQTLKAKLMTPITGSNASRIIMRDLEAIKHYCEGD